MATCLVCGKTFEPKSTVQKYCSQDCQDEIHRQKSRERYRTSGKKYRPEVRSCVICGRKFPTRNDKQICCSTDCRKIYHREYNGQWRRARNEPPAQAICPICGNNFAKSFRTQKFCPDCRQKLNGARGKVSDLTLVCENCGQPFLPTSPAQHFCCKSCAETYRLTHRAKPAKTLEQWQAEATACGLSYGKYRAAISTGKSFEELKL